MEKIVYILSDPKISDAVKEFCKKIVNEYSLEQLFKNALLRTVWTHLKPELIDNEIRKFG